MTRKHATAFSLLCCFFCASPAPFMVACESTKSMMGGADQISKLAGNWNLSELKGLEISKYLPKGGQIPNLSFGKDGSVSGNSGVNRLVSSIDLDALANGQFKMKPAGSTKMLGTPEANKLENDFLSTLQEASGFKIDGDKLSLSKGAETLMKFVRGG